VAAWLLLGTTLGTAQTPGPQPPTLTMPSVAGDDLYLFYCASCHGRDAKGTGPVAPALRVAPADLTVLAQRNGGTFPRDRVFRFVANGGSLPSGAHGSNAMPIWGPIFVALDPSAERAVLRIERIVDYVQSKQAARR